MIWSYYRIYFEVYKAQNELMESFQVVVSVRY